MITTELLSDLEKLGAAGAFRSPMLMLGAQEVRLDGYQTHQAGKFFAGRFDVRRYVDLDMEDGALELDLNQDLDNLSGRFETVFNLGTLEHVWDQHRAWSNALRAVAPGGVFITHSPVGGWTDASGCFNHGLHMTRAAGIHEFIETNGFRPEHAWLSTFRKRGMLLWGWWTKERHIADLGDFARIYRVRGFGPIYRNTAGND